MDTFLSTADDPCWANLKLPFLEITVVPEADSNKNWPTDDVWKKFIFRSYRASTI